MAVNPGPTPLLVLTSLAILLGSCAQTQKPPEVDRFRQADTPKYRVDEAQKDFPFKEYIEGDPVYEWTVTESGSYWIEGSGGGGGGGSGAGGRGVGKYQGGGGAGGNGGFCMPRYRLNLVKGTKIQIRLGHGGNGGEQVSVDAFGAQGQPGANTIVSTNQGILLNFPGASPGGGGRFCTSNICGGDGTLPGKPGNANPPFDIAHYYFTEGGAGSAEGKAAAPPYGGRGGLPGSNGGGGGGGASFRGNGASGGNFVVKCNGVDPPGRNGSFGSGGGGGAGGGGYTCDHGSMGGKGGQGYVWIFVS